MKHLNFLRAISAVVIFLLSASDVFAQPAGANINNAIDIGYLSGTYSDTRNNNPENGYGDDIGQPSDDIYYKFSLSNSKEVSISHCGSGFDTYMYLLDASGTIIASNDDNGPLCATM